MTLRFCIMEEDLVLRGGGGNWSDGRALQSGRKDHVRDYQGYKAFRGNGSENRGTGRTNREFREKDPDKFFT